MRCDTMRWVDGLCCVGFGDGGIEKPPGPKLKVRTLPGLVQFGSTCDRRKLYVDGTRSAIARRLWLQ